ncbi:hypothetical protein C8J57DRAFT_1224172 [Mycena rebaudengoi]|nr:hypothetical protein C8J57DRAFT_1224172 [Mycena rebaudengoi]
MSSSALPPLFAGVNGDLDTLVRQLAREDNHAICHGWSASEYSVDETHTLVRVMPGSANAWFTVFGQLECPRVDVRRFRVRVVCTLFERQLALFKYYLQSLDLPGDIVCVPISSEHSTEDLQDWEGKIVVAHVSISFGPFFHSKMRDDCGTVFVRFRGNLEDLDMTFVDGASHQHPVPRLHFNSCRDTTAFAVGVDLDERARVEVRTTRKPEWRTNELEVCYRVQAESLLHLQVHLKTISKEHPPAGVLTVKRVTRPNMVVEKGSPSPSTYTVESGAVDDGEWNSIPYRALPRKPSAFR